MTTKIVEVKDMKKNPEKIRNSDKFPENKTIISYLRIKFPKIYHSVKKYEDLR